MFSLKPHPLHSRVFAWSLIALSASFCLHNPGQLGLTPPHDTAFYSGQFPKEALNVDYKKAGQGMSRYWYCLLEVELRVSHRTSEITPGLPGSVFTQN